MTEEIQHGIFKSDHEVEILRGDIAIHLKERHKTAMTKKRPELLDLNELTWLLLTHASTPDDAEMVSRLNRIAVKATTFKGKMLSHYDSETLERVQQATRFFMQGYNICMNRFVLNGPHTLVKNDN